MKIVKNAMGKCFDKRHLNIFDVIIESSFQWDIVVEDPVKCQLKSAEIDTKMISSAVSR